MIRYPCGLLKSLLTIFLSLWHTFRIYQLIQVLSLLKWNWLVWFLYISLAVKVSNYRPVSVLPVFSKFLEKAVYNCLIRSFDEHEILHNNQYGFRKKPSTSLALLYLHDTTTTAIDERKHTVRIFLIYLKILFPLMIVFYSISSSRTLGFVVWPQSGLKATFIIGINT